MGTTNYPNSAGIAVYDNTPDPASAQIVDFAFNYAALTDQAEAAELLQNTALFLTTPEVGGTASISGEVTVLGGSNGGVLITANPGGFTATDRVRRHLHHQRPLREHVHGDGDAGRLRLGAADGHAGRGTARDRT